MMKMKILCDVCEKNAATVMCWADHAALCSKCDVHVHAPVAAANNHQRLLLIDPPQLSNTTTTTETPCDICTEKPALIFCVQDRALFCQDCNRTIHSASKLAATHQRFLATGVQLALPTTASPCNNNNNLHPPPKPKPKPTAQTVQYNHHSPHKPASYNKPPPPPTKSNIPYINNKTITHISTASMVPDLG